MPFLDRRQAGRALGERLLDLRGERPIVLALPRGGVVVGAEVARGLGAPLDVVVVRKLRTPDAPELALGAIAEDGTRTVRTALLEEAGLSPDALERILSAERRELEGQVQRYRAVRPAVPLAGRTVVLVDDGLTTGASAAAAAQVVAGRGASRIVAAVPVSSREARESLAQQVGDIVCLETPPLILALDEWYEDFPEVSEDEVLALLTDAAEARGASPIP